jgi:hypothetical protein
MSDSDSDTQLPQRSTMFGKKPKKKEIESDSDEDQLEKDEFSEDEMPSGGDEEDNPPSENGDDIPNEKDEEPKQNDMPVETKSDDEPPPSIPQDGFTLPTSKEQPKVWVLVGSCAAGKTYMLKSVMYQYAQQKHFKFGLTFTQTAFTGDYNWAPEKSIRKWDEEYFKAYIENLQKKVDAGKTKHGNKWQFPHNYVVFDDNNGILTQSEFMINFISTHRHTMTTVFILSQLLTARGAVSTTMRANTSFALMWPTNSKNCMKGLFDNFGGEMDRKQFQAALTKCRERKYSCLVLKNANENDTVETQYCTILAPSFPENFKLVF